MPKENMPQDSLANQLFNLLSEPSIENDNQIKQLLTSEFLVNLIKELEAPSRYEWNAILRAVATFPEAERETLIENASEYLERPFLSYLFTLKKGERPIDIQFIVGLLNLVSTDKRKAWLTPGSQREELLVQALESFIPQGSFIQFFATIPQDDRMQMLWMAEINDHSTSPTLFRRVLNRVFEAKDIELLKQFWELLPADVRMGNLTSEINSEDFPYCFIDDSFTYDFFAIFTPKELSELSEKPQKPSKLHQALQDKTTYEILTPAFDQLDNLGLDQFLPQDPRSEVSPETQKQVYRLLSRPSFLVKLFKEAQAVGYYSKIARAFRMLSEEQLLEILDTVIFPGPNSADGLTRVSLLEYFLRQGAPPDFFDLFIDIIPMKHKNRLLANRGAISILDIALDTHQIEVFLKLVENLPENTRYAAVNWKALRELEELGIRIFKKTWELVPNENRIKELTSLMANNPDLSKIWFNHGILHLLFKTVSDLELELLERHLNCPPQWKPRIQKKLKDPKRNATTFQTLNDGILKLLQTIQRQGDDQYSDRSLFYKNKELKGSSIPFHPTSTDILLYLLAQHAEVDADSLMDSNISKSLCLFTSATEKATEEELSAAAKENKLRLEVVSEFLEDGERTDLTLFLPLYEINIFPDKPFEYAVFTFTKKADILEISLYCNELGEDNLANLRLVLSRTFTGRFVQLSIQKYPHQRSADDLLYILDRYLQVTLKDAYQLELTPELIDTIRGELDIMLSKGILPNPDFERPAKPTELYQEERIAEPEAEAESEHDDGHAVQNEDEGELAMDQFLKILRTDSPKITEELEVLFFQKYEGNQSFLTHLFKGARSPYHFNSILDGLLLIPVEKQQQLLDEATRILETPVLKYWLARDHNGIAFAIGLLYSYPRTKRWSLIKPTSQDDPLINYLLEEPELIVDLLSCLTGEDGIRLLLSRAARSTNRQSLFYDLLEARPTNYELLRKIWNYLLKDDRLDLLKPPESMKDFDYCSEVIGNIISPEELEALKEIARNPVHDLHAIATAVTEKKLDDPASKHPHKDALMRILKENPEQLQAQFIYKISENDFEPTGLLENLVREALEENQWDFIIDVLRGFEEKELQFIFNNHRFNILDYLIRKSAPAQFFKDVLKLVSEGNRIGLIQPDELREVLDTNQLEAFLSMLSTLPDKDKVCALSLMEKIYKLEKSGICILKETWKLLPASTRRVFLEEQTDPSSKNYLQLLIETLTTGELQEISIDPKCPPHWKSSLEQVLAKPEAERGIFSLREFHNKLIADFNAPGEKDIRSSDIYFYFLTKHAGIKAQQQFGPISNKHISFITVTTDPYARHDETSLQKVIDANRHFKTLVQDYFTKYPDKQTMLMPLSLLEIPGLTGLDELSGKRFLQPAIFKFEKGEGKLRVSIHHTFLGTNNFDVIKVLLSGIFHQVHMEYIEVKIPQSGLKFRNYDEEEIEDIHNFLQVSLGEQYKLKLTQELVQKIQNEIDSLRNAEVWPYEELREDDVHSAESEKGMDGGADPAPKPEKRVDVGDGPAPKPEKGVEESNHDSEQPDESEEDQSNRPQPGKPVRLDPTPSIQTKRSPSQPNNPPTSFTKGINMMLLEGFIAVAGITTVALAFALLSAPALYVAAGAGLGFALLGLGLFAYEYNQYENTPKKDSSALARMSV